MQPSPLRQSQQPAAGVNEALRFVYDIDYLQVWLQRKFPLKFALVCFAIGHVF